MSAHWRYLKYVLRHKYFVFVEGRKLGLGIWQLLKHDLSKFSRHEWPHYVRRFFTNKPRDYRQFDIAWLHHIHSNPHHTQHWVLESGAIEIPPKYALEAVADWNAMSRAHPNGPQDTKEWYEHVGSSYVIHPNSRAVIEEALGL